MIVTLLGTGTSHGVPSIDCMRSHHAHCPKGVCKDALAGVDSKLRRTRCSILVEGEGGTILVDVSADFRQQILRERVREINAVLITHNHADHIMGIPDIRSFTHHKSLPVYGSDESIQGIRRTFAYAFDPTTFVGGGIPRLETFSLDETTVVAGMEVTPIPVSHGALSGCLGYRIGTLAYIPDMKSIDDRVLERLRGLDTLILNCLRLEREHSTHLILPQSISLAEQLAPRQCVFVHMSHDIDYRTDYSLLPEWISFGYDGMKIEIES